MNLQLESEQEQGGEKLQEALVAYSLIFYMKPPYTMYNVQCKCTYT